MERPLSIIILCIFVISVVVAESTPESTLYDSIQAGLAEGLKTFSLIAKDGILSVVGESNLSLTVRRYLDATVLLYENVPRHQLSASAMEELRRTFNVSRGLLLEERGIYYILQRIVNFRNTKVTDLFRMRASMALLDTALVKALTPGRNQYDAAVEFCRTVVKQQLGSQLRALAKEVVSAHGANRTNPLFVALDTIRNDRRGLHVLLSGLAQIVLAAAQYDVAHRYFANSAAAPAAVDGWTGWAKDFTDVVYNLDGLVRGQAVDYVKRDVGDFCGRLEVSESANFLLELHEFLEAKYYWRRWCVLIFRVVDAARFAIDARHDYVHIQCGDRYVIVATADLDDTLEPEREMDRFRALENSADVSLAAPRELMARYRSMVDRDDMDDSHDAQFVAFVCWGCDVWFYSGESTYVYRKLSRSGMFWSEAVNAFAFG